MSTLLITDHMINGNDLNENGEHDMTREPMEYISLRKRKRLILLGKC